MNNPLPRPKIPIWNRVVHHWPQKIGALFIAVLIWLFATEDRRSTIERNFEVPVHIIDKSLRASDRVIGGYPDTVRVTLAGNQARMDALTGQRIEADIDVSTWLSNGEFQTNVQVRPPAETRLVRVSPSQVSGVIDSVSTKYMPISPSIANPNGEELLRLRVYPLMAQLRGTITLINKVRYVRTVPVELAEGQHKKVQLMAFDSQNKLLDNIEIAPTTVDVSRVGLGRLPIKTLPVQLKAVPRGWQIESISLEPPAVRVMGLASELAKLDTLEVSVPLKNGVYRAAANIQLPEGLISLDTVSATLKVKGAP